jgi:hypothetical protein
MNVIALVIGSICFVIYWEILPWWLVLLLIPYTAIMYMVGYKEGKRGLA